MAETVHLYLKANGTDVQGESTQTSLGRENSIECVQFNSAIVTSRERGSVAAHSRREFRPIEIIKRWDKSSPELMKCLTENIACEAEFKFFRPNPVGDGTTEHFYTVKIQQARISEILRESPNCLNPASSNSPPLEIIKFVFHTITETHVAAGTEHTDMWDQQR